MNPTAAMQLLTDDPVARELLSSTIPARFAYIGLDGAPRVVPISFHWDGKSIVLSTPPATAKVRALARNPRVAITIDTDTPPYHVLQVRGEAHVETVPGVPGVTRETLTRYNGEEFASGWAEQLDRMFGGTTLIRVAPDWVEVLDFEQRFPAEISKAMAGTASA